MSNKDTRWHVLQYAGRRYKNIPEMALDLAQKMRGQNLMSFLKAHHVCRILVGTEKMGGVAWLIAENACISSLSYRLTLHPNRSISNWIEDLGHEIGHLNAWDFDSIPLMKGEEHFAETFALTWSGISENRIAARKIFCKLIKEKEVKL